MIAAILSSRLAKTIGAALLAILAVLSFGAVKKREGSKDANREAKEADYENADDIRNNVRNNLDSELRKYDGAGYRDGE